MGQQRSVVHIQNPANGQRYTSVRRAQKYVAEGRAVRVAPDMIAFLDHDERHQRVVAGWLAERDGGIATRKMIQHIPVVGDITKLTVRRSR